MNKVPQQHWDETNLDFEFSLPAANDYSRLLINKYVPVTDTGSVIEIGCYPGRYLAIFGDLGYTLHGIDLTPRTPETKLNLENYNYKVGEFKTTDFLAMEVLEKYTVVASFGFIEHFEDYPDIINRHCGLVDKNGYIVIGAPNMRYGLQYVFHRLFNTRSLKMHVLDAMSPKNWKVQLESNGFEVSFAGYCGGLNFWMNKDQSRWQKFFGLQVLRMMRLIKWIFFWVDFNNLNNKYISCDFLVIGKKRLNPI